MNPSAPSHRVVALLLAGALVTAPSWAQETASVVPATHAVSAKKALCMSIVPGLGQHSMGLHKKGLLQEAVFTTGVVLLVAGAGDGDGGGSGYTYDYGGYQPPEHAGRISFAEGDGTGNGDGNGDDGNSGLKAAGVVCMAGSVAWSMIDASMSAKKINDANGMHSEAQDAPEAARLAWAVIPRAGGLHAHVLVHF